jgi:hypothetical protein
MLLPMAMGLLFNLSKKEAKISTSWRSSSSSSSHYSFNHD